MAEGPAEDPLGSSGEQLRASRDKLLAFATVIIPGHGPAFRPDENTPR
jgi:glyoxylase-like metal-dependent hydrolase (beta-lactamase superfamily II)